MMNKIFIMLSGIGIALSLLNIDIGGINAAWLAIIFTGVPIVYGAIVGLCRDFDITADVLVSLALIASIYSQEIFAAGEIAFIMQLGALLEEMTVNRARRGIERLVALTPTTARVVTGKKENIISADSVKIGDIIKVLPGETIPVDGTILTGASAVNEAAITGEALPVNKNTGDSVLSGTINGYGSLTLRAEKCGADSSMQRMIKLVKSADANKAKIVRLADKWAVYIVITAVAVAVASFFITGELSRAVTVLVVFCPCALVLATPTAIMAAIGNAGQHGFLVRAGDALERLAAVKKIAFDKTGTLTYGTPAVTAIETVNGFSSEKLISLAASLENLSEHPIGKAIARYYLDNHGEFMPVTDFNMTLGAGLSGITDGKKIIIGTPSLLTQHNISLSPELAARAKILEDSGATTVYVAIDSILAGFIALSDTLRPSSPAAIKALQELNISPVLLTGDKNSTARAIANAAGITEIYARCLPETKLSYIQKFQAAGQPACMIGDGINDAPALKTAHTSIAMGGVGSDIALDAADIVLVNDNIAKIPYLVALSRQMMKTIKLNLSFSLVLNFAAIVMAVTGILNPVSGALVHNAGSVLVIVNSALLLKWKIRYN